MDNAQNFNALQDTLGYRFNNLALLEEALRHSSFVNEQADASMRDNERMEFLGDAVLNLVVGHLLMFDYPEMREGELSRIRANMVNETQLAAIGRELDLGAYLLLGKGEIQSNGRDKNSLLANAVEAVIAAIYMDGNFDAAFGFIKLHFQSLVDGAPTLGLGQDFKSRLQEAVQSAFKAVPQYRVIQETGPDHDKTFHVSMTVGKIEAQGVGKSKKTAEQDAARQGLELFEARDN